MIDRTALAQERVTLNGKPAKIVGTRNEYPRVVIIATGEGYEWSWEACARVVANGGRFES